MSFQLATDETIALQRYLKKIGANLGAYGPHRDGVDGLGGDATRKEFRRLFSRYFDTEPEAIAPKSPRTSLPWMVEAERWLGLKEIPGPKHHAQILKWWSAIKAPFTDDETPWCAGFVGGVLGSAGLKSTRSAAARSYHNWGIELAKPALGAITVFWRGSREGWSGHVAFLVGVTPSGDLICLGGNQSDAVTVAKFSTDRLLSFRWPSDSTISPQSPPILSGPSAYSVNEA